MNDIIDHIRYLKSIDLVTLYDVLPAYFPFYLSDEPSRTSFVLCILWVAR